MFRKRNVQKFTGHTLLKVRLTHIVLSSTCSCARARACVCVLYVCVCVCMPIYGQAHVNVWFLFVARLCDCCAGNEKASKILVQGG